MKYTIFDKVTGEIKGWGYGQPASLTRTLAKHPDREAIAGNYKPDATVVDTTTHLPVALSEEEREARQKQLMQALGIGDAGDQQE